ncbi:MAG: ATP phosphoribosyltransferase [Dehalococcoidia bacterium]|nr:ATP phosphoribosyltransferase [Dehalococcoidia bacterium]
MLRLALPSKGELESPALAFLKACGIGVNRPNSRQYTAEIPGLRGATVLFQRAADIAAKVAEGSVDLGITGLDTVKETLHFGSRVDVLIEDLDFGGCDLVVAIPETWIDVSSMADLVEVAEEMRAQGMELRVATKYNRLVRRFFLEKGLNFFSMVASTGAIEVAPTMGFADVIADLTSSGTTLRENGLKTLSDGTILNSQACLLGNLDALRRDPDAMATTKAILERMEACLRARDYFTVTANIRGESAEAVGMFVMNEPDVAGMQGPTVSKVYSRHEDGMEWYATTVVVRKDKLLRAVEHLRGVGGSGLTVSSPNYVFGAASEAYQRLLGALDRAPVA